jgi:uncharacterized protein (TIGR02996 family)
MPEESAFLDAIRTSPDDDTPRLVYADWLEERSDPRGEFLRLDGAIAQLAVADPRYAEVESRLELLAGVIDRGWLARVGERNELRYDVIRTACPPHLRGIVLLNLCRLRGIQLGSPAYFPTRRLLEVAPGTIERGQRRVDAEAVKQVIANIDRGEFDADRERQLDAGQALGAFDPEKARQAYQRFVEVADVEVRINRPLSALRSFRRSLPSPVRETIADGESILEGGYPVLVALRASEGELAVCEAGVRWEGPHTPVAHHRPCAQWRWAELPEGGAERFRVVGAAVQEVVRIRQGAFRSCRYCTKQNPPEWMHAGDVCSGCAERYLGIVH